MNITCFISVGELFDKISILKIKKSKAKAVENRVLLDKELKELITCFEKNVKTNQKSVFYMEQLNEINQKLWDLEDKIRLKENEQDFGDEFIELSRSIFKTNDRRSFLKKEINLFYNSPLREIKLYNGHEY